MNGHMQCFWIALVLLPILTAAAKLDKPVLSAAAGGATHGCTAPELKIIDDAAADGLTGTLFVNDKSKGTAWLINLDAWRIKSVELPLVGGNHEAAISPDGSTVAIPHYETTTALGQGEGGGTPGSGVSILDIQTGEARVMVAPPNPFGAAKPHGAAWTDAGDLLVTAQLKNGLVRYSQPQAGLGSSGALSATKLPLESSGCNTPHLVLMVPGTALAVTGCRCTNADAPCRGKTGAGTGKLALVDLATGETQVLDAGAGAEGIAVTAAGAVWVGSQTENYVSVFAFVGPKAVGNLRLVETIPIAKPLRLAYDALSDTVAVASATWLIDSKVDIGLVDGNNLALFSASSRKHIASARVSSSRGLVNMEGLGAFSVGTRAYFFTGGFDSQTLVLLDASSLAAVAEIYMPRCSTPRGHCTPTHLNTTEAIAQNMPGNNNWSGGYCPATLRGPWDQRFAVFDGFNWSPLKAPAWAASTGGSSSDEPVQTSSSFEFGATAGALVSVALLLSLVVSFGLTIVACRGTSPRHHQPIYRELANGPGGV